MWFPLVVNTIVFKKTPVVSGHRWYAEMADKHNKTQEADLCPGWSPANYTVEQRNQ